MDSDADFLSRYALMTFYYATGGENLWTYDLDIAEPDVHRCSWNRMFLSFNGARIDKGVGCNTRNEVTKIEIGKCFENVSDTRDVE